MPWDIGAVRYEDADSPTGTLISDLQRRLAELGARDIDGSPPEITGRYDEKTARMLAHWIACDVRRWPDPAWLEVTWGHPVTDCNVWRALGFDCEAVEVVPGVTPMAEAIQRAVEEGSLSLTCAPPTPPAPRETGIPAWLILVGLGILLARRRR